MLREREDRRLESWKTAFGAGLMKAGAERPTGWITKAELFACLTATGAGDVTEHQLERWRAAGFIQRADQEPLKGRGSVVRYPPGSCEQIRATRAFFRFKNRNDYVGEALWWHGFPVPEKYWRPKLQSAGKSFDRARSLIKRIDLLFERRDKSSVDVIVHYPVSNIILSRIVRRLDIEELKTCARVAIEIGLGQFEGFEISVAGEERTFDKKVTIKALDIGASEKDAILGEKLKLLDALPEVLKDLSTGFNTGVLANAANEPEATIAAARADAVNAFVIGVSLYETWSWVYGSRAFGLRFLHWVALKAPQVAMRVLLLALLRFRAVPGAMLSSEKIASMAKMAMQMRAASLQLKHLGETDPRFRDVLSPRRVRRAFVDQISLKQWRKEIKTAKISERDKHPPGG